MAPLRLRDNRLWALVCVSALLVAVPVLLWRGLVTLPHRYDDLRAHGVPVRLQVTRCGRHRRWSRGSATADEVSRRSGAGPRGTEVFAALLCALLAGAVALLSIALARRRESLPA